MPSLINVQSRIPNSVPDISLHEKGKLVSASGDTVPWVLFPSHLSPHLAALTTWASGVGEGRKMSLLNTVALAQTENPSFYSSRHSRGRPGFSKPCSARACGQGKEGKHPEQQILFSTFCICMSGLQKGSSVLSKEVGEPLFWSIMHLHFVGNINDKMTKRKKQIKHVYFFMPR